VYIVASTMELFSFKLVAELLLSEVLILLEIAVHMAWFSYWSITQQL